MSHYSDDSRSVRVDFFRDFGKWYTTEAVIWTGRYADVLIHSAFAKSLRDHFRENPRRLADMIAVCLEPYHEHGHPIMFTPGRWLDPKFDESAAALKSEPSPPAQKFDIDGPGGLPLDSEGYPAPCAICGRTMCDHLPNERPDSWDNTVGRRSS